VTGPALPQGEPRFLAARASFGEARFVLFGCPFDETASFRPGARFGPRAIREFSDVLETYSPDLDADLDDVPFCDLGDLALPAGDIEAALGVIRAEARRLLAAGKIPFGLGGEHLISLPLIEAALEAHPDLVIFQWDAHADLREEYEGARLSHATVMRRAIEAAGGGEDRLVQFGVRSGTRGEWEWMHGRGLPRPLAAAEVSAALAENAGRPLYLTLDVDVLDPSECPGTGTPEPGGARFTELAACIGALRGGPIVALDVVELAPRIDPSGASAVCTAKAVRELILAASARP
jgi:agmatinase